MRASTLASARFDIGQRLSQDIDVASPKKLDRLTAYQKEEIGLLLPSLSQWRPETHSAAAFFLYFVGVATRRRVERKGPNSVRPWRVHVGTRYV
jgi:hypothetical protein